MYDVLVVVITNPSTQLLVVHLWFVLTSTPELGNLVRVSHLELPSVTRPSDTTVARTIREQFQKELPQLDRSVTCT